LATELSTQQLLSSIQDWQILVHIGLLIEKVAHRAKCNVGKTSQQRNVDKLRIILLFKGDFNNNNKWFGRAVMFHAVNHKLLAPEQYGSHKEKSAAIQCLNKQL